MPEEIDAIKTSRQEQRNNKRLLLSDNLKGVTGPWDCVEMDEVEVDLSLVSADDPKKLSDGQLCMSCWICIRG